MGSTEYTCAFEITRTFTAPDVDHDPDPGEVMAILVRQVEYALRTLSTVRGTTTFKRLRSANIECWVGAHHDGSPDG